MTEEKEEPKHGLKSYSSYLREEISTAVQEALDSVVGDSEFQEHRIDPWINAVLESCLARFIRLQKNHKFIATCLVSPNDGSGLHGQSACCWQTGADHSLVYDWQNAHVRVCVTVYSISAARLH